MGDKGETSVNSCGPRHPGETSVNSCGPSVRDKGGDKCKLMRPKEPRVGDEAETSVQGTQSGKQGGDKCTRHPEWETRGRQV